jgi:hypothetical protein
MDCLVLVNVPLDKIQYRDWINDSCKFLLVLIVIHVLMFLTRQSETTSNALFNVNFLKLLLFTFIGIIAYHLVFRKLICFRFRNEDENEAPRAIYSFNLRLPQLNFREWLKISEQK